MKTESLCQDYSFRLAFFLNGFGPKSLTAIVGNPTWAGVPQLAQAGRAVLARLTRAGRPMGLRETLELSREIESGESLEVAARTIAMRSCIRSRVLAQGGTAEEADRAAGLYEWFGREALDRSEELCKTWDGLRAKGIRLDLLGPPWPTPVLIGEMTASEKNTTQGA